jgi:chemotaxis protein MotB
VNQASEKDSKVPEIIIVRRIGNDEPLAKGGAWKIAYADFVTAMMAFFLVMWLINSANEVTKSRVASYFNPIKMTDAAPSGRGLKTDANSKRAQSVDSVSETDAEVSQNHNETEQGRKQAETESKNTTFDFAMMADPFRALEVISTESAGSTSNRKRDIVSQSTGDPFDPMAWEALRRGTTQARLNDKTSLGEIQAETGEGISGDKVVGSEREMESKEQKDSKSANIKETAQDSAAIQNRTPEQPEYEWGKSPLSVQPEHVNSSTSANHVSKFKQEIELIKERVGGLSDIAVEVKMTPEGLLIALEDGKSISMFRVGSAQPNPALIKLIGGIGNLLERLNGKVIIRGHTDARKYKGTRFDNWQLSTARAHMASYMLIRGGMSENRILKIEGYGAAKLRLATDPLADSNRRVEFLLGIGGK